MMKSGYGIIKTAIITGTAATLITAPLSMYVFGTTNRVFLKAGKKAQIKR